MTTKMKRISILAGFTMLVVLLLVGQGLAQTELTPVEELGKFLYFDVNLSDCSLVEEGEVCNPDCQSCASCHDPHTTNTTFLRIENDNSDVCLACHTK